MKCHFAITLICITGLKPNRGSGVGSANRPAISRSYSFHSAASMIKAVIFDLDGVLLQSEEVWDEVREQLARDTGGKWHSMASRDMMGMSSPEWSRYMSEELGLPMTPNEINQEVVRGMEAAYSAHLPLISGAHEAVQRMAARWPLGLASSSNRQLIDRALREAELSDLFQATVSSEEVDRGKPHPDVFQEVARQLKVEPGHAAAIEDSHNGVRSAHAAGMAVVLIPNAAFPPREEASALAGAILGELSELTVELIDGMD